jgi:hypothetical protein
MDTETNYARFGHSCNVVGNRQMVVIGGAIDTAQQDGVVDPWSNGIGIFDLSEMQWKDSYNATAGAYVTPEFVKSQNEQRPTPDEWSDSVVKDWFTQKGADPSYSSTAGVTFANRTSIDEQSTKICPHLLLTTHILLRDRQT